MADCPFHCGGNCFVSTCTIFIVTCIVPIIQCKCVCNIEFISETKDCDEADDGHLRYIHAGMSHVHAGVSHVHAGMSHEVNCMTFQFGNRELVLLHISIAGLLLLRTCVTKKPFPRKPPSEATSHLLYHLLLGMRQAT